MKIQEVEKYFGSLYNVCKQLKIATANITMWRKKGYIPWLQQYKIAELTEGDLMPDEIDPKLAYKNK